MFITSVYARHHHLMLVNSSARARIWHRSRTTSPHVAVLTAEPCGAPTRGRRDIDDGHRGVDRPRAKRGTADDRVVDRERAALERARHVVAAARRNGRRPA